MYVCIYIYIYTSKCTCPIVQEQMIATTMTLSSIYSTYFTVHELYKETTAAATLEQWL